MLFCLQKEIAVQNKSAQGCSEIELHEMGPVREQCVHLQTATGKLTENKITRRGNCVLKENKYFDSVASTEAQNYKINKLFQFYFFLVKVRSGEYFFSRKRAKQFLFSGRAAPKPWTLATCRSHREHQCNRT